MSGQKKKRRNNEKVKPRSSDECASARFVVAVRTFARTSRL